MTANSYAMTPEESVQYALEVYPTNVMMRAIHAAFQATLNLTGNPYARPNHVPIRIVSSAGVGKTAIPADYCRREGFWYHKLDTAVTDAAEVIGFKQTLNGQTISALPSWWPEEGVTGIINVDDSARAERHIQNFIQQLITERSFNGVKLPDTIAIVCTDNPDNDPDYFLTPRDVAQNTRTIDLVWNPHPDLFIEQLDVQRVDRRIADFWLASPELRETPRLPIPRNRKVNDRMRTMFSHLFPFIVDDPELFTLVTANLFGEGFERQYRNFTDDDPPFDPQWILSDRFDVETIRRWEVEGKNGHLTATMYRLTRTLQQLSYVTADQWTGISRFLQLVPKDTGTLLIRRMADRQDRIGQNFRPLLDRDTTLLSRYSAYLESLDAQLV